MGLPTMVWSEEMFKCIAELWGKYVYSDDRTGESLSFSVARFLIDSFEWENINEWVSVTVGERRFDVFVREFTSEVYSRESHPNAAELAYMAADEEMSKTESRVEETPMNNQKPLAEVERDGGVISNEINVVHVSCLEKNDEEINVAIDDHGMRGGDTRQKGVEARRRNSEDCMGIEYENWADGLCAEPDGTLGLDDEVGCKKRQQQQKTVEHNGSAGDLDSSSCLYPPGYGPCTSTTNVHDPRGSADRVQSELVQDQVHIERTDQENLVGTTADQENTKLVSDTLGEAVRNKELCEIGGFSFNNNNINVVLATIGGADKGGTKTQHGKQGSARQEKERSSSMCSSSDVPLATLLGLKSEKKGKGASQTKKQKTPKQGPNLKGRNLSTRLLSAGPKTKTR
ncbi:hypothetical protein PIB30_030294 [Stylosanthes scabra]|uniref:Uncharacterized protein n=1 Tax=Stylosanthes scabra TaxID=79078 RepID=A0ABU6QB24_9FABA|nr:hypothetical protein [Stylosanthes scabra]